MKFSWFSFHPFQGQLFAHVTPCFHHPKSANLHSNVWGLHFWNFTETLPERQLSCGARYADGGCCRRCTDLRFIGLWPLIAFLQLASEPSEECTVNTSEMTRKIRGRPVASMTQTLTLKWCFYEKKFMVLYLGGGNICVLRKRHCGGGG